MPFVLSDVCFKPILEEDAITQPIAQLKLKRGSFSSNPNEVTCKDCLEEMRHS